MKVIKFEKNRQGQISTLTNQLHFVRSEFHCRFPSLFAMNTPARWASYHRSNRKLLDKVKIKDYTFEGNQSFIVGRMYPKTGNFFSPFAFTNYKQAIKPTRTKIIPSAAAYWYDTLLQRQKEMAAYVVAQVKGRDENFSINSDNNYTCILFSLPKPADEKNPETWSQFVLVYLIAITNKLAQERGINIEMVRRSSFGCLRPAVSHCGESVRINLGLSPKAYADCVVDALFYVNRLFNNPEAFKVTFKPLSLMTKLIAYNKAKSRPNKKVVHVHLKTTLWDTLWAAGDSLNKSFASQFFRKPVVVECLIDAILDGCLAAPLDQLFNNTAQFTKAFIDPLKTCLQAIHINKGKLSIGLNETHLKPFQWGKAKAIDDKDFWDLIEALAKRSQVAKSEFQPVINRKKTEDLHSRFEAWLGNFVFKPMADSSVKDGYGSDSEEEGELELGDRTLTVHAKKFITATGMRAIQLIYAAARKYLHDEYDIDPLQMDFNASKMYYETNTALTSHPIPLDFKKDKPQKRKQCNISFFDVNHCNTSHAASSDPLSLIENKDQICVFDITSATTEEIHNTLVRLWQNKPQLQVIITISSGLKNEQAMSDYNPYGSIRIFAKDNNALDKVYDDLIQLEFDADYRHPKESHLIRKTAKIAGMTPTNAAILAGKAF